MQQLATTKLYICHKFLFRRIYTANSARWLCAKDTWNVLNWFLALVSRTVIVALLAFDYDLCMFLETSIIYNILFFFTFFALNTGKCFERRFRSKYQKVEPHSYNHKYTCKNAAAACGPLYFPYHINFEDSFIPTPFNTQCKIQLPRPIGLRLTRGLSKFLTLVTT